jgi:hypothetical protein
MPANNIASRYYCGISVFAGRGGGEPSARFQAMTFQAVAKPMIAAGLVTKEQNDSFQRLFLDPAFNYLGVTIFAAWGRRPALQV